MRVAPTCVARCVLRAVSTHLAFASLALRALRALRVARCALRARRVRRARCVCPAHVVRALRAFCACLLYTSPSPRD
eukprot:997609-Alexandrium_andersonii.AAC.1